MIETDNGSSFLFSDQYEINNAVQEVKMSRNVTVVETGVRDIGFSTEFAVPLPRGEKAIGQRNMMFSFRVSGTKRIKGS